MKTVFVFLVKGEDPFYPNRNKISLSIDRKTVKLKKTSMRAQFSLLILAT